MSALIAALAGGGAAVGLWVVLGDLYRTPSLGRTNVAGREVPIGGGIVIMLAVVLVAAGDRLVSTALRASDELIVTRVPSPVVIAVLAFGFLGLLDDLLESGDVKGFRGHLRSLIRGELTTGAVKLFGGGLVALIVAPVRSDDRLLWLIVDAAIIALGANLANLLDRAPGRVAKAGTLLGAAVIVAAPEAQTSVGLAVVIGATAAMLWPDLRERVMLGDAGANALGAAVAWGFVSVASPAARVAALLALVGLNVASEKVSFSRVIAATPGLRGLDALGRRATPPADDSPG